MANMASVLKEEIRRLARKEAKLQTVPLLKALAAERKNVAALRKQVASLGRAGGAPAAAGARVAAGVTPVTADPSKAPKNWRKDTVRSTRKKLGLTQAQFSKLIGVSQISVSFWETGRSTPRPKAQALILAAGKLSPAAAQARVGGGGASRGKRKVASKTGRARKAKTRARRRKA